VQWKYALLDIHEGEGDQNLDLRNLDKQISFKWRLINLSKGQQSAVYGR
jgi:hypothetical protein